MEGILAMPIVTMSLPVNVFLTTLMTKGMPFSKPDVGGITAAPFACNFLQVFFSPIVTRRAPVKATAIVAAGLHALTWFWLAWRLPTLVAQPPAEAARTFLVWFFISSVFNALLAVVWNIWMHDLVPARLRGRYFGQRNRAAQASTLVFVLLTGWILARGGYSARTFQWVIAVSAAIRLISLYFFWLQPASRPSGQHADQVPPQPLLAQARVLAGSHSLLLFIAFGALWSFATNCFGPFYHVFLYEQLGMSGTEVGVLATLTALGGVLSLPFWGPLLDRFGNRSVMCVALALLQTQQALWCVLTPANRDLLYPIWLLTGSLNAGFVLGQFTILLKLIPPAAKNLAIGLNLAVTSAVAAVSPVVGGAALGWAQAKGYPPLQTYQAAFVLQPVLCLVGCLLLLRIQEPASSPLGSVIGAMRNIRTLGGVLGLSFLVNYLFAKPVQRQR